MACELLFAGSSKWLPNGPMTAIQRRALPVAGSNGLPAGFWHPHASEHARAIAGDGMILRMQVGSGVHGTAVTPATSCCAWP